jgi:hypothetical protein
MNAQAQIDWLASPPPRDKPAVTDRRRMTRRHPRATEVLAADRVARRLSELHTAVLEAFRDHGAMTDEQLEQLPRFAAYGPSTIRKRRSELLQQGRLVACGEATNSRGQRMKIWRVSTPAPAATEG